MIIIENCIQGSDQWLKLKSHHDSASEASAMMGASKNTSRDELLRMKATGAEKEFSDWVRENLLERGHEIEAAARPMAEKIIGKELYPITATDDDGNLLVSYDGTTMDETVSWECKLWNEAKAADVRVGHIPDEDYWQVVQQLCVGPKKCLYMVTDGTPEKTEYLWKELVEAERKNLLAGWSQFNADLANYKFVEAELEPTAKAIKELPTLSIRLVGEVTNSNLIAYRETALAFIRDINTDLQTDQDFVNAEAMVKFCGNAEKELETAKKMALAQTASIDELFRTVDVLKEEMRKKRLDLDKLVKARKQSIRIEIQQEANKTLTEHVKKLDERLGKPYLGSIHADFAGVMKGKKTVTSLRGAVNDELARAKIEANEIADRIEINLKTLRNMANEHAFLFADTPQIIMKENDDLVALIKVRIADHKAEEEKKLEAERERIRAEEKAKAEAEAGKKSEAERKQIREEEQVKAEAEAKTNQEALAADRNKMQAAADERHTEAGAELPITAIVQGVKSEPSSLGRPSDSMIIKTLAQYYNADESEVVTWIVDMDLRKAS